MATPSLLIIPDRFKAAKLYSQLPESGAGDFTVTRGTTATRVNASGLIESVASGVPRIDYTGGGCGSLLVEPAATNLALRSEEFNDASWSKTAVTVSANTTVAPNGATTADEVFDTATLSGHAINQTITVVSGSISASIYIKGITRRYVGVRLFVPTNGVDVGRHSIVVDTTNGAITATLTSGQPIANITSSVQSLPNGWYRVRLSGTSPAGVAALMAWHSPSATPTNDGFATTVYLGEGFSFAAWGAQLETGSVATSYIPTVASTVTRNADVISRTAASGLIGQAEGTLYVQVDVRALGIQRGFISVNLNSNTTDLVSLQILASNFINARLRTQTGSLIDVTTSGAVSGSVKAACSYSSGNLTMAVNGVIIGTNTNATVNFTSPLNFITIGSGPAAASGGTQSNFINDRISAGALYTSRLSNAELIELTTL